MLPTSKQQPFGNAERFPLDLKKAEILFIWSISVPSRSFSMWFSGVMSSLNGFSTAFLPSSNDGRGDDGEKKSAIAPGKAEDTDVPAQSKDPQEPSLITESHGIYASASGYLSTFHPATVDQGASAKKMSRLPAPIGCDWMRASCVDQLHDLLNVDVSLREPLTEMMDDEPIPVSPKSRVETTLVGILEAPSNPEEKEVCMYTNSLSKTESFDSTDWTVCDASSPTPSTMLCDANGRIDLGTTVTKPTKPTPCYNVGVHHPPACTSTFLYPPTNISSSELNPSGSFSRHPNSLTTGLLSRNHPPISNVVSTEESVTGSYLDVPYYGLGSLPALYTSGNSMCSASVAPVYPPGAFLVHHAPQLATRGSPPLRDDGELFTSAKRASPALPRSEKFVEPSKEPLIVQAPHFPSKPPPDQKDASSSAIAKKRIGRWTKGEDALLARAMDETKDSIGRVNWNTVSRDYFHGTRNKAQCKNRWRKTLCPEIRRTPFTPEEDAIIIRSRDKGLRFSDVARLYLPHRSSDMIRFRYTNALDPSRKTRKNIPWSEDEKQILLDAQKALGNKWTMIAKLLPGRSDNDVKNFWHNRKDSNRRAEIRKQSIQSAAHTVEIASAASTLTITTPAEINSNSDDAKQGGVEPKPFPV